MSTAIEKLEEIIEQQDEKIAELEEQLERNERCAEWQVSRYVNEKNMNAQYPGYDKLPLPRLEMRVNLLDDNGYRVEYLHGIVYKHFDDSMLFIPYEQTIVTGSRGEQIKNGDIDFPFRQGPHLIGDSIMFNMPAFVLCMGKIHSAITMGNLNLKSIEERVKELIRK